MGRDSNKGGNGDGKSDGIEIYPATPEDLRSYRDANADLAQMRVPQLVGEDHPNRRLFVAVMDGTGNDMHNDPVANRTGVARIYQDIRDAERFGEVSNVSASYITGPGTQEGWWAKTKDGAQGHTVDERAETMYKNFIERAFAWKQENPDAQISVAAMGFSRGAEEVALFTRMVDQRGIQDPTGAKYTYDDNGLVKSASYSKPPIVEPGQVAQAVMLHDPVGTGKALDMDRRLPSSVVSGLQVFSEDERRNLFKGSHLLPRENGGNTLSEDGRMLNVTVGGAHSDIGGAYTRKGLGTLSENLARDYINGLSDRPIVPRQQEPADPSQYVVHRSEQHQWFYRTSEFDKAGERQINADLAPKGADGDRRQKAPIDEALSGRFEYHTPQTFPIRGPAAEQADQRQGAIAPVEGQGQGQGREAALFERLAGAARDPQAAPEALRGIAADYLRAPEQQQWLEAGRAHHREQQAQDIAQPAPQQAMPPPQIESPERSAPTMRQ